jgi:hypothetical protein
MVINPQSEFQAQDPQQSTPQNQIKLVPYVQLEGEWILSEEYLDSVFDKMVSQGLLKTTFWEENITDQSHFVAMARSPNTHMVLFFEGQECVGFAWLSAVTSNYAFAHFCLFREIWGRSVEIGKIGVDYWFSWPGTNGPLLDVIIGIIPGFNKRAHRYVEKLGWTRLGNIPGMFRDKSGVREDAEIYYVSNDNGQG